MQGMELRFLRRIREYDDKTGRLHNEAVRDFYEFSLDLAKLLENRLILFNSPIRKLIRQLK